jgi:hypothetical protein
MSDIWICSKLKNHTNKYLITYYITLALYYEVINMFNRKIEKRTNEKEDDKSRKPGKLKSALASAAVLVSTIAVGAFSATCATRLIPESQPREDAGLDADTDSDLDSRVDSDLDIRPDARSDSDPDHYPDGDADADFDADPDAELDAEIDVDAEADLDADPDAEIDLDADPDAELDAEIDVDAEADLDADPDLAFDGDLDLEVDADSEFDADAEFDADFDLDADSEFDAGPDCLVYSDVEADVLMPLHPGDEGSYHPVRVPGTDVYLDLTRYTGSSLDLGFYVDDFEVAHIAALGLGGAIRTTVSSDGCDATISARWASQALDSLRMWVSIEP